VGGSDIPAGTTASIHPCWAVIEATAATRFDVVRRLKEF